MREYSKLTYYNTDLGIVIVEGNEIRLKSALKKTLIAKEDFDKSNPVKISKGKYLELLNTFFRNLKVSWWFEREEYRKMDNFDVCKFGSISNGSISNYDYSKLPKHQINDSYGSQSILVMYKGKLYFTFFNGNCYPQMQLIDFYTKELTTKWTNIKNLAPIFNISRTKIM